MSDLNRRDLCLALSSLAALGGTAPMLQAKSIASDQADPVLGTSRVIPYAQLAVEKDANGIETRKVMSGAVKTGEFLEIHETTLPPGQMPHPPHRHLNSEILFIQQGTLEYLNDGKPEPVSPGGIIFTASNVLHGIKNTGDTPAIYIVVSIGRKLKET